MSSSPKEQRRNDVFERENEDARKIALAAVNAHKASGGRFASVSWKHEGRTGPTTIRVESLGEPRAEAPLGIPFGPPCKACGWPEGMHDRAKSDEGGMYLGWLTRAEALRIAKWAGVPLHSE